MSKKTVVALTGSSGIVGQAVVAHLVACQTYDLICIDIAPPPPSAPALPEGSCFRKADLTNPDEARAALEGAEELIHFAAFPNPVGRDSHLTFNTNVTSVYNVLSIAIALGITNIVQASSVNATGLGYGHGPRFDKFPLSEATVPYIDDAYALSKQVCELVAIQLTNYHPNVRIASLRFHWALPNRHSIPVITPEFGAGQTWGWVPLPACASACTLALQSDAWKGHEAFCIVGSQITEERTEDGKLMTSESLRKEFWPDVPVRDGWFGEGEDEQKGFYDCSKARRVLGWDDIEEEMGSRSKGQANGAAH